MRGSRLERLFRSPSPIAASVAFRDASGDAIMIVAMPTSSEIDARRGNVDRVLERDLLGVVELLHTDVGLVVCRRPTPVPVVGWIASALARREQRALRVLAGLDGVPAALSGASPRRLFTRGLRRRLASGEPERRRHEWPKRVDVTSRPGNGGTA